MTQETCNELEKMLRAQRHDFINHIQVIHAMLQMGRVEKAMKYIEDIAKDPELVAEPLRRYREQQDCQRHTGL
jgi:sensor histidine kinase regulating citrate/malate metabolism